MSESLHVVAASGSALTVDVSVADVWDVTLTANCTLSLTGATAGVADTVALLLRQDGTGSRTVTWPGSVTWPAGSAPTLHAGAADVTLVTLTSDDGGTTWIGFAEPSDGADGANGVDGVDGAAGPAGGAIAIPYVFSTTTTDSDPGNGNLRLDNATQNAATTVRADLLDANGVDWTAVLDELDDSTSTIKGYLRLFKTGDPTKFLLFTVSATASPSGYRNITVANVASSSASPFANSDPITLAFTRTGDKGAAGSGSVASDSIWDAKGDLAVGTGADTAAKLTAGSNGQVLTVDSTQTTGLKWGAAGGISSGTSFPGSPSANDLFYRTDLHLIFYYDGTRWLSIDLFTSAFSVGDALLPFTWTQTSITLGRIPTPYVASGDDLWLVSAVFASFSLATVNGSNFTTLTLNKRNAANTATALASRTTASDTASNWARAEVAIGALLGGASTWPELDLTVTKTGTPGNIYAICQLAYRIKAS